MLPICATWLNSDRSLHRFSGLGSGEESNLRLRVAYHTLPPRFRSFLRSVQPADVCSFVNESDWIALLAGLNVRLFAAFEVYVQRLRDTVGIGHNYSLVVSGVYVSLTLDNRIKVAMDNIHFAFCEFTLLSLSKF